MPNLPALGFIPTLPRKLPRFALAGRCCAFLILMGSNVVLASPLEPKLSKEESFRETFTALADLQDGSYVQLQIGVSNLGRGSAHGACRAMVIQPGQKPWNVAAKFKRSQWAFQATPVPQLRVGPCTVWTGPRIEVHAEVEGGTVHMVLRTPLRAVSPPDSAIREGKTFYRYQILVPWAEVEVDLTLPDQAPRHLQGFGYADTLRSNAKPKQVAARWVRLRALNNGQSTLLLIRQPHKDHAAKGWVWSQDQDAPQPLVSSEVVRKQTDKKTVWWELSARDALGREFRATTRSRLFRYAPVEQFGFVGFLARPFVGNPITETFRAQLRQLPSGDQRSAIMEVSRAN